MYVYIAVDLFGINNIKKAHSALSSTIFSEHHAKVA